MALDMSFLIADPDYYAPWDTADPGPRYDAGVMPDGRVRRDSGILAGGSGDRATRRGVTG